MNLKNIVKAIAVIVIVIVAGLVLLTIVPEFGGFKALVVTSSSMEPTVPVGSMVFVKKTDMFKEGNVITFQTGADSRSLTTHRVVKIVQVNEKEMYQTKGDAVQSPDLQLVPKNRVVGKVIFTLPYIGRPIAFAKTQLGVVVLVVVPAAIIVYEEFKSIGREVAYLRGKVKKLEREEGELEIKEQKLEKKLRKK